MGDKKILVIGGTGKLGFPVAKQLLKDGFTVDILTRNPNEAAKKFGDSFSFVDGDVRSLISLREIIRDYYGIHINLNATNYHDLSEVEVKGTANIAKTAKEANVKKITLISGLGVNEKNAWSRYIRAKIDVEKAVKISGIPYTIFNCTHFMEGIPDYIRNGKISIIGNQPHPIRWLAANDYTKMVSKSYEIDSCDFKKISVVGPASYTMTEAFNMYIDKVDKDLKIAQIPLPVMRLMALLTFNKSLGFVVDLMKYFGQTPEEISSNSECKELGLPDTDLKAWMQGEH